MPLITLDAIKQRLDTALPDGTTRTFQQLVEAAGDLRGPVLAVAFGQPDTVTRKDNKFVALAKEPATTRRWGITLASAARVEFSITFGKNLWQVRQIKGVHVYLPFPISLVFPDFDLTEADVSMDRSNNFLLSTKPYGNKTVTARIGQDGKFKLF